MALDVWMFQVDVVPQPGLAALQCQTGQLERRRNQTHSVFVNSLLVLQEFVWDAVRGKAWIWVDLSVKIHGKK